MREVGKRVIIFGTIFILITMSIVPIYASETTKDQNPEKAQSATHYTLATIEIRCDWIWKPFVPLSINVTWNNQTEYEFPEINGTIQTNFTVVIKYRLENWVIIPRWIKVFILIWQGTDYIWNLNTTYFRCSGLKWKYHNITLNNNNQINPPIVNKTLVAGFSVSEFPTNIMPVGTTKKEFTISAGPDP